MFISRGRKLEKPTSLLSLIESIKPNVNRWAYPHSSRAFSYIDKDIKKVFYYNVNFLCNSKCIFCASDLTSNKKFGLMSFRDIQNSLRNSLSDTGNAVIFNGGEATLFTGISDLIELANSYKSQVILFTNGRKFADFGFAKDVLRNLSRVTIPLYGADPTHHDRMTATVGSFEETLKGVKHIFDLKNTTLPNLQIELKCLSVQPCLEQIPKIIDFIVHEFGLPDRFVLSGVIPSKRVLSQKDKILPEWKTLRSSIQNSFYSLIQNGLQVISLPDLPLCLLTKDQLEYFLLRIRVEGDKFLPVNFLYFDVFHPGGVVPGTKFEKPFICSNCVLSDICDADNEFINRIDPDYKNIEVERSQLLELII
jgi:sulfatase maturation enzyme AslB (radical SAM superfamily)